MRESRPRIALGIGIASVLLCVAAGFMVAPQRNDTSKVVERLQRRAMAFRNMTSWSDNDARSFASDLLALNDARPAALTYEQGVLSILVPMEPSFIDRIFSPGTKSFQGFELRDFNGSFGKRWKAGLSARFGVVRKSSGRPSSYFSPNFGHITISPTPGRTGSTNPLDYLDFSFRK